jgi:hypothetical protein
MTWLVPYLDIVVPTLKLQLIFSHLMHSGFKVALPGHKLGKIVFQQHGKSNGNTRYLEHPNSTQDLPVHDL